MVTLGSKKHFHEKMKNRITEEIFRLDIFENTFAPLEKSRKFISLFFREIQGSVLSFCFTEKKQNFRKPFFETL